MDDGLAFFCGSVPILILLGLGHGGGGPIRQLAILAAGCIGGLVAYMAFGQQFAGGGVVSLFLISVAGGSFLGVAADALLGRNVGAVETKVG
jgi:hypothetical protein